MEFRPLIPFGKRKPRLGFSLVEVAIALILLTVVSGVSVDLTAKAMNDTNWSTHMALADAYLDREAALMRRLSATNLFERGFTAAGVSQPTPIYLAFSVVNGATNGNTVFQAQNITRQLVSSQVTTNNLGNTVINTYTVTMKIESYNAFLTNNTPYIKSRTVTRTFAN